MTDFSDWPWEYNFPPFFTIQSNQATLKHQLTTWRTLVINFFKSNKLCVLDVREASKLPLFNNVAISRQLNQEGVIVVLKELARTGHAEPFDKSLLRWYIFWEPLEQIAAGLYKWAVDRGMTNTVCTLFELSNGDSTTTETFHGVDEAVLEKALKKLELDQKAEVFAFDNSKGVKFF